MITKAAIIGAGTMGHGIAQLFAQYGLQVTLYDINEAALQSAARHIRRNLELLESERPKYDTTVRDIEAIEGLVQYTTNLRDAVHEADLILEAAPERLEIKHELYRQLESLIKPDAIVASNTSTYPLEQLSEGISFADRMLILHFFNPAFLVPLVEIVKQPNTPDVTLQHITELLRGCGKVPVVLKKDVTGFIANRLQSALLREAAHLLELGIAEAHEIDAAVKHGPGLRWALQGPLETADFGGLDVWEKVSSQLFPLLDVSRSAPEVIRRNVQQGRLGTKNGKGIYDYADAAALNQVLEERDRKLIRLVQARQSSSEGGIPE
ncbi:MAG: 3-hydroxybutyryl-CoA dehydrogenase [Paenibacillus sp.]|nr:3-hydroxybutyryl-CoA dehydrogenase [Paenibacillus sp.]